MKRMTKLVLDTGDVHQILDALEIRMDDWAYTAHYLREEHEWKDVLRPILECNSAREAQQMTATYRRIIRAIRKQIGQ